MAVLAATLNLLEVLGTGSSRIMSSARAQSIRRLQCPLASCRHRRDGNGIDGSSAGACDGLLSTRLFLSFPFHNVFLVCGVPFNFSVPSENACYDCTIQVGIGWCALLCSFGGADQASPRFDWHVGLRLVCHCKPHEVCHCDSIIEELTTLYPWAHDRVLTTTPPSSETLNHLAKLREEPFREDGSSADDSVPPSGAVWHRRGEVMMTGIGYTARELCDKQTLASPGRWPVPQRRYPCSAKWRTVPDRYTTYVRAHGSTELPMIFRTCLSFSAQTINELKNPMTADLELDGMAIEKSPLDTRAIPTDVQFSRRAAQDPQVGLGDFVLGLRAVLQRCTMPRPAALHKAKKKWNSLDCLDGAQRPGRGIIIPPGQNLQTRLSNFVMIRQPGARSYVGRRHQLVTNILISWLHLWRTCARTSRTEYLQQGSSLMAPTKRALREKAKG